MDADRFDALSRALSAARSRRGTIRGILGALFGGLLLPATSDPDALAGRHKGKHKPHGGKQRGQWRQGLNRKSNGKNAEGQREDGRAGAEACKPPGGRCTKAKERKCCSKQCSNKGKCLCTAANQCPRPDNPCQRAVCSRGRCQKKSRGDGAPCPDGTCQSGQCELDSVDPTCTDNVKNGNESDVDCGGSCPKCGNGKSCNGNGDCQSGHCCGGACITEGESCNTGHQGICATGTRQCVNDNEVCVGIQPGSQPEICDGQDNDCDGQIDEDFDLDNDDENCGECGNVCTVDHGTATCIEGNCVLTSCDVDWGDCNNNVSDGCETQLGTAENCGFCGDVCSAPNATATCETQACIYTCDPGFENCDGGWGNGCETDLNNDPEHCGSCAGPDAICAPGELCVNGVCV